ncbi:MAG: HAD family hydrolase, partial [Firmicutes bacterium]|nr:HAD family hydrolase [Bacillota bacterium]
EGLKIYKPRPQFYLAILEKEGIRPEEAVFIGDSVLEDVQAPKELGMRAIWVNRRKTSAPYGQDAEVRGLDELEDILRYI